MSKDSDYLFGKTFTVGLAFSLDLSHVALIKKIRPEWQKGYLNGIGGMKKDGESPIAVMVREFLEETGFVTKPSDWTFILHYQHQKNSVFFFKSVTDLNNLKQATDEEIKIVPVNRLYDYKIIANLYWIIPLAIDPNHKYYNRIFIESSADFKGD